MVITFVQQPTETSCAPACVAMITGVDVNQLIREMSPKRTSGCRGRVIVEALRRHGVVCDDRFKTLHGKPFSAYPELAVVRVVWPNKRGHVVVKSGRMWFDPLLQAPFAGAPILVGKVAPWTGGGRITSALRIYQPDK